VACCIGNLHKSLIRKRRERSAGAALRAGCGARMHGIRHGN
jgi:hypothetical protein